MRQAQAHVLVQVVVTLVGHEAVRMLQYTPLNAPTVSCASSSSSFALLSASAASCVAVMDRQGRPYGARTASTPT